MSFEFQNTLQQDLMLLAKNQYKTTNLIAACRLICSRHVLCPYESLTVADLTHWLLKEFVTPGLILPEREDLVRFIFDLAEAERDRQLWRVLNIRNPAPEELVAECLLDKICMLRVRDESGAWIEPWMDAKIDPTFVSLLEGYGLLEKEDAAV